MSNINVTGTPGFLGTGAVVQKQVYTDPNRSNNLGDVVAIVLADGTIWTGAGGGGGGGNVTMNDPAPTTGTLTAADGASAVQASLVAGQVIYTGTPTAGSSVSATVTGCTSFAIQLTGTTVATCQFEKSTDGGVTWVVTSVLGFGTGLTISTLTGAGVNANAVVHGNAADITNIRVRNTAFTSGSWSVTIQPSYGVYSILSSLAVGSNVVGKFSTDLTTPGTTNKVAVSDSLGGAISAFPGTFLRVTDEPRQVFYDPFDSSLDTTNRWTTPTVNAPGVVAAVSAGVMTMGTGTTASGWSKLTSQATFTLPIPAWLGFSFAIAIPDLAAINANTTRFWGSGSIPATPTVTVPITDGVGFELSSGKMFAVVYANGTRTQVADLTTLGLAPTDTATHRYIVYVRTDKCYWYIDGLTSAQLVATSNFQSPQIQTLGETFVAVGSGSNVAAANITCSGAVVWDTGKNATQLADGTFPWRKASISSTGALSTSLSTSLDDVNDAITNKEKWRAMATVFSFFDDAGVNPTLKNLASAALIISAEYDNTANLYQWMELELLVRGAVAFTAGSTVDFWIVPALDGTNYSDGSASVTPARSPDGYFNLRAVATALRLVPLGGNPVSVPPCKFKILARNSGGQAFTNTNSENVLKGWAH